MTDECRTSCGRPAHDSLLCPTCLAEVERALAEVPWLADQLDVVLARQSRGGARGDGPRSAERPLPYSEHASTAAGDLRAVLVRWCRTLDHPAPADLAAKPAAWWLLHRVHRIALHPDAATAHARITRAAAAALAAVDRPPDLVCAGPCLVPDPATGRECPAYLYARAGDAWVECRGCGITHDVTERRDWMRAQVEQTLMTAAEAARWAAYLGIAGVTDTRRTAKLVTTWADRGRLTVHGHNHVGAPMFRFGDVVELLAASPRRSPAQPSAQEAS